MKGTKKKKMKMNRKKTGSFFQNDNNEINDKTKKKEIIRDSSETFHKSIKQINNTSCSPKPTSEINNFSCFTNKSLFELQTFWNKRFPTSKIISNDPREIHRQLEINLKGICQDEMCWIQNNQIALGDYLSDDTKNSFAPLAPSNWSKNPNEWVSNFDIMKVIKQFKKIYPCFEFIGPTSIDFNYILYDKECVCNELCYFSLEKYIQQKKTKIGIIFNTDTHDEDGEHWISMFINLKKKQITYFDSVGNELPNEIANLIQKIIQQGKQLNNPIDFEVVTIDNVEHQLKDSECGVYSLFFIINLLEDTIDNKFLLNHIFRDDYIQQFRKIYFNVRDKKKTKKRKSKKKKKNSKKNKKRKNRSKRKHNK